MQLPREPQAGEPISALWGALIVRYLRAITPKESGDVLPQRGPGGTTFVLRQSPRGRRAPLSPFDATIAVDPEDESLLTVTFEPGTGNGLLPTNMFDTFNANVDDLWYCKLQAATDGEKITSCDLVVDNDNVAIQSPTPFTLPSSFSVLLGIINDGAWYRTVGRGSLVFAGNQDYVIEKDPPADPGELTYTPYFAWKWWTDALVEAVI